MVYILAIVQVKINKEFINGFIPNHMKDLKLKAINIRQAKIEDLTTLSVLSIQTWLDTYATEGISDEIADFVLKEFLPEKFLTKFKSQEESFFVAELSNNIIGYIELVKNRPCPFDANKTLEIDTLYIMPSFHGYGIGPTLLSAALKHHKFQGYQSIWLSTWHKNINAIRFYEKSGFRKLGKITVKINNIDAPNYIYLKDID